MSDDPKALADFIRKKETKRNFPTVGISIRIPIDVLADLQAMSSHASVSRNDMAVRLLRSAIADVYQVLFDEEDHASVADLQTEANQFLEDYFDHSADEDQVEGD